MNATATPSPKKKKPRQTARKYSQEQRLAICEDFEKSGLTKSRYCGKVGITHDQLNYWLRGCGMLHLIASPSRVPHTPPAPAPAAETEPTYALELHIRGSLDIYFAELPDPLWLARFLSSMK